MQTVYEIKQLRNRAQELTDMAPEQRHKLKSKKKDDNVVQYGLFVPPGRHFFYMIYQDKHNFLSPHFDIVRFKGTNVFLN